MSNAADARTLSVELHRHGGVFWFGLVTTMQPLGLLELAQFERNKKAVNVAIYGEIIAHMIESQQRDAKSLSTQRGIIASPMTDLSERSFWKLVQDVFPHDEITKTKVPKLRDLHSAFQPVVIETLAIFTGS